jgi:two-component system NtrC family sensor kinase
MIGAEERAGQRGSEERYRLLFESMQEGVFVTTPGGRLIDCNPSFASMLGYPGREAMLNIDIGKNLFVNAEQRAAYEAEMGKQGCLRNYEISLRRQNGSIAAFLENSSAVRDSEGRIERYQGFLMEFTERKLSEEEMWRRNRELGALNAMASIASLDLDEILQNTLRWVTEIFSERCDILLFDLESGHVTHSETSRESRDKEREELRRMVEQDLTGHIARVSSESVTEHDLGRLPSAAQTWIAQHGYESFVAVMMHSQGKTLGILLISSPSKNRFTDRDHYLALAIGRQLGSSVEKVLLYEETARAYDNLRNAQEQLLQSEKMSAVGQLISGVAHELNNPLTAILGYAQLLETEPIGERARDYVRKLYLQTQRTHRVVQNLLSFSRQRKPLQSQVDLRRVLEDTLALREFDFKLNNVHVEREYNSDVPFINGDAHQLEQVFLNIINNAVDAIMDSARAGSLKVRVYAENNRVCVEFRDSGPGLKDPGKIFDPFYTTKKIGKGTGLGLSICYGIVKEHGGDIFAFNHEQGGAVFQLKLPVTAPEKGLKYAGPNLKHG